MTAEELDTVIVRFRAGGQIEYSNYHAGERIVWEHETQSGLFLKRTMGAWSEDYTERFTETQLREKLAPLPFADWSG